jgi:hypothetical protein
MVGSTHLNGMLMLGHVTAIEHIQATTSGKTHPSIIVGERPDHSTVELVAKFSAGCEEKERGLAREAIAACLASDLGLPVPAPFLVDLPPGWADAVSDPSQRARVQNSSTVAFGSHLMTEGYSIWHPGNVIDSAMLPVAAAVFVFDLIIQNIDRRADNPNCLIKGSEICIFDHELAFMHGVVIGWRPPWVLGGLRDFEQPGKHIFREGLSKKKIDYEPIRAAWANLPDARIAQYEAELPVEWAVAAPAVQKALTLVRDARDNIAGCLKEVKRVLTS